MITKEKIALAAQKWAVDTKKKFPHLSEPEFIAGAEWAFSKVDPRCDEILEKINVIMWNSYLRRGKGITAADCDAIMCLLNEWASFDLSKTAK